MRIIKLADPAAWKHNWICKGCGSHLECDGRDIRMGGSGMDPGGDDTPYVNCPVCDTQITFVDGRTQYGITTSPVVPKSVMKQVIERK